MKRRFAHGLIVFLFCGSAALGQGQANGINQEALATLLKRAEVAHSDAVIILKDNKLVGESYFGKPKEKIEIMSCTKSVVNLAVGRLIDAGKIKSLDQPVHEFYPEWKQGNKKLITIRHLLNHTSGLQNIPNATVEIYPAENVVKLALSAELSDAPGSRFHYNNKAVNLLAGIIQLASGKRMDSYIADEILTPLGITDYKWGLDPSSTPFAMAGLQLHAIDFAKIGQLVLNKGTWEGKRIVSEQWLNETLKQGQPFYPLAGLLWWRVPASERIVIDDAKFKELEAANINPAFISKLMPLKNVVFTDSFSYFMTLSRTFGTGLEEPINTELAGKKIELARRETGEIVGYSAVGDLGQYLVVLPRQNLVAVRLVKRTSAYNPQTDWFNDFAGLVQALVH
jgi:CubicO group peptidase (beta-lactamase class C family)